MLAWLPAWLVGGGAKRVADRAGALIAARAATRAAQAEEKALAAAAPEIKVSINEAGDQQLNKMNKLATAETAVNTAYLARLATAEFSRVNALYAKHGLGTDTGADDVGIIVCDDYHVNDQPPPPSGIGPLGAAALVAGVLLAGLGAGYVANSLVNKPPPATNTENTTGFLLKFVEPGK